MSEQNETKKQTYSEFNTSLFEQSLSLLTKSLNSVEAGNIDAIGMRDITMQGVWLSAMAQTVALMRIADVAERWEETRFKQKGV